MNRAFRNLVLLLIVALTSVHINFSYTQSVQKGAYAVSSSLKSDADYVISAFGLATDFSPERAARGYIAAQAYAIASNPAFKRAILQYAKGKNPKTVLNQAIRGGQSWLSKISHGSLMFRELSKPAREAIAQSQYELEKKLVAKLSIKNRKSGKLAKNRRKAKQERSRMVSNASKVTEFSAEQAAQMMAIFLKLNIIEADKDAEIMPELSKKASQLRCLSMAKTKMSRCLIDSKNADDVVFCQIVFSQEQLACYSN